MTTRTSINGARSAVVLRWLGGATFLISLGYAASAYAVRFSSMLPFAGWRPAATDAGLFMIFAVHHSVFARDRVKRALRRTIPESAFRSVYVWSASLLLIGVLYGWQLIGGVLYAVDGAAAWAMRAVLLAGVWLIARSVRAIDALDLAGIREPPERATLQVDGPYALVRHPVYLGWLMIVFAVPVMTGDRAVFAIVSSTYIAAAIPLEERSLLRVFGASYRQYAQRVRWRIVPGIY